MTLDDLLNKQYIEGEYVCGDWVHDAWEAITGQRLAHRIVTAADRKNWQLLKEPQSPCIVWFSRPNNDSHVGIWYEGRVGHLRQAGPAWHEPDIAALGYSKRSYVIPR